MHKIDAKISISKGILSREVDGELIIIELESGKYFGLDEIGTRMWQHLTQHEKIEEVCSRLM